MVKPYQAQPNGSSRRRKARNNMRGLFGKKAKAKAGQPTRQRPMVNQDADLARKEAREIESYGKKRFWLKKQNFGW